MINYTKNLAANQRRTAWATGILAFFTVILAISTIAYVVVSYKTYQGSERQIAATNRLALASQNQAFALSKLEKPMKDIPERIKTLAYDVHMLPFNFPKYWDFFHEEPVKDPPKNQKKLDSRNRRRSEGTGYGGAGRR